MTGGTTYIEIRDVNGNKISLTSTPQNIKPGTYKKIKRAIEYQKEIVFIDIISNTLPICAFSEGTYSFKVTSLNAETIRVTVTGIGANGTNIVFSVIITEEDKAYTASIT